MEGRPLTSVFYDHIDYLKLDSAYLFAAIV